MAGRGWQWHTHSGTRGPTPMGRMLEVLRQTHQYTPEPLAGITGQEEPRPGGEARVEEIPFVEVGPFHSMEASPSVLASAPPRTTLPSPGRTPPGPVGVSFRAVAARVEPPEPRSLV